MADMAGEVVLHSCQGLYVSAISGYEPVTFWLWVHIHLMVAEGLQQKWNMSSVQTHLIDLLKDRTLNQEPVLFWTHAQLPLPLIYLANGLCPGVLRCLLSFFMHKIIRGMSSWSVVYCHTVLSGPQGGCHTITGTCCLLKLSEVNHQ